MIIRLFSLFTFLVFLPIDSYAAHEIEPVTLSEINAASVFSNQDAEILRKSTHIDVDQNYHETLTTYIAIKINSSNAINDYSQLKVSYDGYYEESELVFANTIDAKGNRQALDPNALQVQTPPSPYFFQDRRDIVFSVPSLKPGTVIEYQYTKKTRELRIPNYWGSNLHFYFWQIDPSAQSYRVDSIRNSDYVISLPESLNTTLRYINGNNQFKTKQTSTAGITTYKFYAKNLPAVEFQSDMPSTQEFMPYISLTTLSDWSEIKSWAYNLFKKEHIVNDEVKAIASVIKSKNSTEQSMIQGVYEYLNNNVRYVYSHVGRGGFTPHKPSHTLNQGFGDCKDQTMLAVALLNELGIEAYAALVNTDTSTRFDIEKYNPSFDHMLVYMPEQPEGYRWMDTTSNKSMYPGALSFMSERDALILSDKPNLNFVKGRKQTPSDNAFNFDINIDKVEGENLIGTLKLMPTGRFEAYYRALVNQNNKTEERTFFTSLLQLVFNTAELTSIDVKNNENLFLPVIVTINFKIKNAWQLAPTPLSYSFSYQHIWRKLFSPNSWETPEVRVTPMYNALSYAMNITFKSSIPEKNYYLQTLSSGIDMSNDYFSIKNNFETTDTGSKLSLHGEFNKAWINTSEYKTFFETYDKWLLTSFWNFSYVQDKNRSTETALLLKAEESIEATNQLIQLHLDEGDFEKALTSAKEAVKRSDVSGHTYHLLGLSQAYNDDADSSEASFKKAQELGYE